MFGGNPDAPGRELACELALNSLEAEWAPLWQRAQAGDEQAYAQCLRRVGARLRAYFWRRLSDPGEVEDLVQETLLALHLARATHDPALPVSVWVHAIARHKLIDALRRRGRQAAWLDYVDELPEALEPGSEQDLGAPRDVQRLLAELPQRQRQAIECTKLLGLSVTDAAQRLGCSESVVKVSVHRGLKRLAAWMRGET